MATPASNRRNDPTRPPSVFGAPVPLISATTCSSACISSRPSQPGVAPIARPRRPAGRGYRETTGQDPHSLIAILRAAFRRRWRVHVSPWCCRSPGERSQEPESLNSKERQSSSNACPLYRQETNWSHDPDTGADKYILSFLAQLRTCRQRKLTLH